MGGNGYPLQSPPSHHVVVVVEFSRPLAADTPWTWTRRAREPKGELVTSATLVVTRSY